MMELSLAVVGISYLNEDKTSRMIELLRCTRGEPVELRPDPKNRKDPNAIAVFSARGAQVGFLTAERAPYIGARLRNGEPSRAVFQDLDVSAAYIRVRFGGDAPTLPASRGDHFADEAERAPSPAPQRRSRVIDPDAFYPDPEPGMWGA
jgi:hypothetical protein